MPAMAAGRRPSVRDAAAVLYHLCGRAREMKAAAEAARDRAGKVAAANIEAQLERIAQQVVFKVAPPSPAGSVETLANMAERIRRRMEGRTTSAWDGDGSQRTRTSYSAEEDIEASSRIDEEILFRLKSWKSLRGFLAAEGYAVAAEGKVRPRCLACSSPHAADVDRMLFEEGLPERDVEEWLRRRDATVSDTTLRRHRRHAARPAVPGGNGKSGEAKK